MLDSSSTSTSPAPIPTGYSSRSEPLVLPRNAAALHTSTRPSSVICRAAFSAVVIPITRRPVSLIQACAYAATVCVFPGARGRGQDGHHGRGSQQPDHGVLLLPGQPRPGQGPACHALADPLRDLLAWRRMRSSRSRCPVVVYRASFGGR